MAMAARYIPYFLLMALSFMLSFAQANDNYDYALAAFQQARYPEGVEFLKKAALQGNDKAQNDLGILYHKGMYVPRDYKEALKWYRKSAKQGYPFAMLNIGLLYYKGHGVQQNYVKARSWFLKAARKGDPDAQFNLGVMYQNGNGMKQDIYKAYVWYAISAINGSKKGLDARDLVAMDFDKQKIAQGDGEAQKFYERYPPQSY